MFGQNLAELSFLFSSLFKRQILPLQMQSLQRIPNQYQYHRIAGSSNSVQRGLFSYHKRTLIFVILSIDIRLQTAVINHSCFYDAGYLRSSCQELRHIFFMKLVVQLNLIGFVFYIAYLFMPNILFFGQFDGKTVMITWESLIIVNIKAPLHLSSLTLHEGRTGIHENFILILVKTDHRRLNRNFIPPKTLFNLDGTFIWQPQTLPREQKSVELSVPHSHPFLLFTDADGDAVAFGKFIFAYLSEVHERSVCVKFWFLEKQTLDIILQTIGRIHRIGF